MAINYHIASLLIKLVASIGFPIAFIWAVNTLFGLGIPFTLRTWLASLLLFLTLRFFVNRTYYPAARDYSDYEADEDEDEYDEEYDDDDDEPEPNDPNKRRIRRIK
jgi:hypothetical protein